jgi:integrase
MQFTDRPASGHVTRRDGPRGSVWYAKYRLPDGCQVQRKIGPAHTGRGKPPQGYFTRRTAQRWLEDTLREADAGTLPGAVRTGVTFAEAAREWLRYVEHDRGCKPSTLRNYRSPVEARLIPVFGATRIEDITTQHIERWRTTLSCGPRTENQLLTELHGTFKRDARLRPADQPGRRPREAPGPAQLRHRGVLA